MRSPTSSSSIPVAPAVETTGRFPRIAGAEGRAVVLVAVHHVRVDGITYTGGAEKFILSVIPALIEAGARVHVGYSGTSIYDDLLDAYHPTRLTVERTDWLDDALSGDREVGLRRTLDRARWFRSTGADTALFVQQASGAAFRASVVGARLAGLRIVSTLRQPPMPIDASASTRVRGLLRRRRLVRRHRFPATLSTRLIYNSERIAAAYESQYAFPRRKRLVVRNGASPADFIEARRMTHRFATVGRLTEAKGAELLLSAFERLALRDDSASLTFFGDGPLRESLGERIATARLAGRVRLAGFVADRAMIYTNVDIYVHASRRESMSNSVIEAMARGIPCVVTDVGGMSEAVVHGETGLVVPADDVAALADAMARLTEDRELYDRCAAGSLERARALFDENANMEALVRGVLGID